MVETADSQRRRPHVHRQRDEQRDGVLGDHPVEDQLEDVSRGRGDGRVAYGDGETGGGCKQVMMVGGGRMDIAAFRLRSFVAKYAPQDDRFLKADGLGDVAGP